MCSVVDCTNEKICAEQLIKADDDSFAEEFICQICQVHVVGCGPKLTKCSHLFCGDCLQQWVESHPCNQTWAQRAKTGGAVPCPVCKTMLQKGTDLYPIEKDGDDNSAFLWQMIQTLQVRCDGRHSTRADGGCCWTGGIGAFWDHLQSGTCGQDIDAKEPEIAILSEDSATESWPETWTASISEEEPEILPKVIDKESGTQSCDAESTCSQCSRESSWEDVSEGSDVDTKPPHEATKPPHEAMECTDPSSAADLLGQDLTSLIKAFVDLNVNQANSSVPDKTTAGADELLAMPAPHSSTPASAASSEPMSHSDNLQQAAASSTDLSKKACAETPKKQAAKGKKAKKATAASDATAAQDQALAKAAQEWQAKASDTAALREQARAKVAQQWQAYQYQAYQWQAAQYQQYCQQYQKYQMACAYQYQMAVNGAHAQQALHRQKQMKSNTK